MEFIGVIGLLLAIVVLILGAYKGIGALPLTLGAGLIVVLSNSMPFWQSYADFYMGGYVNYWKSYFLIFVFSALYAKVMEESGAVLSIAYKFIDWFGKGRAMLIVLLTTTVLTYGGVSLFVVIFAIGPIAMLLFKEADIARRHIIAPLLTGYGTFTMTALPGSPQLTNVIPSKYLGTTLTAAPVLGIVASLMIFGMCYGYCKYVEKKSRAAGEHFSFPANVDPSKYEVDRTTLPSAITSFIPLITIVGMIILFRKIITDSTFLVVMAMGTATVLAIVLNYARLGNFKAIFNQGMGSAVGAIAGPCAIVAFGVLVKNAPAFQNIVSYVLSLQMNTYVLGIVGTAVISGVTGSSSGGLTITLETLAEKFVASGVNLGILHRLISIAAGTLDSLPHSTSFFLVFDYLGVTHKESYFHAFIISVIVPIITVTVCAIGVIALAL
jgi:H+/gluconate symporter-like permease